MSSIRCDITFPSVVYKKNEDGTYKIIKEGQFYNVPCGLGMELGLMQSVWVTIPCNMTNLKDMYISGLRGTTIR